MLRTRKAALEDIDEAYSTLSDPAKKREYDACLSKTEKGMARTRLT